MKDWFFNLMHRRRKPSSSGALRRVGGKVTNKRNKSLIGKLFKIFILAFASVIVVGAIGLTVLVFIYSKNLPAPGAPFTQKYQQSLSIYSSSGVLLSTFHGAQNRDSVNLSDVSPYMQWAVIAAENKNFYHEPLGISIRGILRAFIHDYILHESGLQGGSTITQELVKLSVLTDQRTISRKIEELILTVEVSQKYSKKEILQAYLNELPFGGNVYGVDVAAHTYFGISPKQLDLAQSAILAGMVQAPSYYSPLFGTDPKAMVPRADYVLNQMLADSSETGVTASQVALAKKEVANMQYNTASLSNNIKAPWFVYYVKNLLEQKYGVSAVDNSGWKVYTTLNWQIEQDAENTVTNAVNYLISHGLNAHNAALVSVDPNNGEILSMVGSYKYGVSLYGGQMNGDYNAALAERQPGSSIKPFLYMAAFQDLGFSPTTLMPDLPININGYAPTDWNNTFEGPEDISVAIRGSRNVPAVKTLYALGVPKFIDELHKFGYTGLSSYQNDLSIAIGAADTTLLQHTEAYGILANGGVKYPTTAILKIVSPQGKVIYQYKPQGTRIIDRRYTYLMDTILEGYPTLYYSPSPIYGGYANGIGAKTGTTNQNKDLVLMGYTPTLATGMWAGNDNNAPTTYNSWGEDLTPFWNAYMEEVLPMFPKETFTRPPGIVTAYVCVDDGMLASPTTPCKKTLGYFAQGQLPQPDNENIQYKVCNQNPSELATPSQIAAGDYHEATYIQLKEYSPIFQPALDAWEKTAGPQYNPPTQYCTGYGVSISVTSPKNNQTYSVATPQGSINVSGSASSSNTISSIVISLLDSSGNVVKNGLQQDTDTINNNSLFNINFSVPTVPGSYTVQITATDSSGSTQTSKIPITVALTSG